MGKLFTSESVTEGHPDKIADQISDAILDELLRRDPYARVAAETTVATGLALVVGEITTKAYVDISKVVKDTIREIGYAMNPDVTVNTYRQFVTSENILDLIADYDFIIDGTDNFPAKFLINDACVMSKKPFSHAGIIRFKGQLMTYVPGQGPCYRCVFKNPPPKDAVPTCKQAGVIGAMGGVIGSLQAMEAIKYILGVGDLLTGYLLTYDAIKQEFHKIKLPANTNGCAVCGKHPTITELIDYEQAVCTEKI